MTSPRTIAPSILISAEFSNHTLAGLSAQINGSILKYYIHESEGNVILDNGSRARSVGHSAEEIAFINDIFLKLDPLIELDFLKQDNFEGTLLDIYSLDQFSEWDESIVGQVVDQGAYENSYWDVLWRDTDGEARLSTFDASTIVHEIGHALGLSHPEEDPYNEEWNTSDTVMSYNEGDNGWDTWFSTADIRALQLIWGAENGQTIFPISSDSGINSPAVQVGRFIGTSFEDEITGTNNNDQIQAIAGNDFIYARGGDDVIYPGKGEDFAWGGDGADAFIVNTRHYRGPKTIDYLMDFQEGTDKIIFKGSTKGLAIKSYQDSSYISKHGKILVWIDGAEWALLNWDSANQIT